ncbi:MAG: tandem-95 repeat protein, partial [Chloroflexi bacterium]
GSFDAGELGIQGVAVTRAGTSSGAATTDANGNYSFVNLSAGTYSVDYTVPSGFVNTGTKPITGISLAAGQTAVGQNFFAQRRNASIAGTVYNDLNGNGSFDTGEPGVVGISVTYGGGTPATSGTATTGSGGAYTINGLQAGTYTIDYTPPSGFVNTGTKPISVILSAGQSATGENFFTRQSNRAPTAANDTATTREDTAVTIDVLANDSDADGTTPTVKASSITSPAHGTAVLITTGPDTGKVLYTPAANYNGPDSFTYKATDGSLDSNVAAVSITITPVNDAPICTNVSITTNEDTAGAVDPSCADVDGDILIYTVGAATNGTSSFSGAKLRYSPNANFNGSDSFS